MEVYPSTVFGFFTFSEICNLLDSGSVTTETCCRMYDIK
jgi:hypothetical protein